MTFKFTIVPLDPAHERRSFSSGSEPLDIYFKERVSQDIRRRLSACYVALETETGRVCAYYSLATASVALDELPMELRKKLPRYPFVPAVRLGRLAVDQEFRGRGLGGSMLLNAVARAIRSEIRSYAMIVDAKDEAAVAFYLRHGFRPFQTSPQALFLELAEAARRIKQVNSA